MDYLYKFKDGLTIVKDDMPLTDHCMHYSDNWESLIPFKVPGKMRKTKQLYDQWGRKTGQLYCGRGLWNQ